MLARLAPGCEVLAVIEEQMVSRLSKAALRTFDRDVGFVTATIESYFDRGTVRELRNGRLADRGVSLLTDLAGVMDYVTIPAVDPVMRVPEASDKDVVSAM